MQQEPPEVALGVHGSERRECSPKPCEIQRLRPWEPEARVQIRRRLNNAALHASARARRATSPDACGLFHEIARIAAQWTLAWEPDDELEAKLSDILNALTRMFIAADALERNGSGL